MTIKTTTLVENGKNLGDTKEVIATRNLIVFKDNQFHELACVRWYMSRSKTSSRIYCTIWTWTKLFGQCASGHAVSDGYGFCKQSDSFERALNSAGIYSSEPISGRGMSTVEDFLLELAHHAGYENAYIARG